MKIQLSSTLPFTPLQLDSHQETPRRAVGQLHGTHEDGRDYCMAVYEFRHGDDDEIHYQVDPSERMFFDGASEAEVPSATVSPNGTLEWIGHDDSLTYKPYAFLVMNAMTRLIGDWDGVVYQTPSGERLRDSVWNATLQVVDACVCNKFGLWVMVNLTGDKTVPQGGVAGSAAVARQQGWVPLQAVAH